MTTLETTQFSLPDGRLPAVDTTEFRRAMRLPAATVTLVTSGAAGARVGVTATAVCSLSDSPPMLLVCLNHNSSALETIRTTGAFCVNYLGKDEMNLAVDFAGRTGLKGEDRFGDPRWSLLATGAPVLPSALAAFDCELVSEYDSPTHAILLGKIAAISTQDEGVPLLYSGGGFGQMQVQ